MSELAPIDLTVIAIVHDEAIHIERMIKSVRGLARRVVLVDSGSTDGTVALAQAMGAEVHTNPFTSHAAQVQWAIENTGIDSEWVMRLDADEYIEPDLAANLRATLPDAAGEVTGVNLKRKHIFMGRWVRHGGRYPLLMLRVWRRGAAHCEQRWMDEHMVLDRGRAITLDGGFADDNLKGVSFFIAKHNDYATREAVEQLDRTRRFLPGRAGEAGAERTASVQARLKRWLKRNVFEPLPHEIAATALLVWRLVFRLGLLDGRSGIAYHVMQGFWYRYLVGTKRRELESLLSACPDDDIATVRRVIAEATGLRLEPLATGSESAVVDQHAHGLEQDP